MTLKSSSFLLGLGPDISVCLCLSISEKVSNCRTFYNGTFELQNSESSSPERKPGINMMAIDCTFSLLHPITGVH